MWRLAVLATLTGSLGCRLSLDEADPIVAIDAKIPNDGDPPLVDAPPSAACQLAETYQDLATIEAKIFKGSCVFSGCHDGNVSNEAGRQDLRLTHAFASLVGKDSQIITGKKLVVPGQPDQSYLMNMIGELPFQAGEEPPATVGLMPQDTGGVLLCSQKRQAIARWITAGAQND